jgi:hypothetical protein
MEVWKALDFEGLEKYQVSNWGRVKNSNTGIILKQQKNMYGYMVVMLWKYNGKEKATPKQCQVHRLIAHAFKPAQNENSLIVNHIDFNRSNNNINNLEWCTAKENAEKKTPKEQFYNSQGCYDDKGNYFNSYHEAARFYNISPNTVKRDCLGLTTRIENYKGNGGRPTFHK